MAREIRHEAREPAVLDETDLGDDGKLYVCSCDLSDERPLWDGSHEAVADEEEGAVYEYEDDSPDSERRVVGGFEFDDE